MQDFKNQQPIKADPVATPPKPVVIPPTVGRVVWYYERKDAPVQAAMICKVVDERRVNLVVFDEYGGPSGRVSIQLVQEGDAQPLPGKGYATWMPYQIGQAKKS